jgi:hypothetical protein
MVWLKSLAYPSGEEGGKILFQMISTCFATLEEGGRGSAPCEVHPQKCIVNYYERKYFKFDSNKEPKHDDIPIGLFWLRYYVLKSVSNIEEGRVASKKSSFKNLAVPASSFCRYQSTFNCWHIYPKNSRNKDILVSS